MKMTLCLGLISACSILAAFGQTIETEWTEYPRRNITFCAYDNDYLFVGRNYGSSSDPRGQTKPALFVHSKKHDLWLQITKVATNGFRYYEHKSQIGDESASIGHDLDMTSHFKESSMVDMPIESVSLIFPDLLELDHEEGRYRLAFNSKLNSVIRPFDLFFLKRDLDRAFEELLSARQAVAADGQEGAVESVTNIKKNRGEQGADGQSATVVNPKAE